jgi:FtsP/CotA-like multicopper oxidase with cupredoxin domain
MYHPHADEMTQMAMGMMGFWITHPKVKTPLISEVDRDFVFLLNAYDINRQHDAKTMTMLDFTCGRGTAGCSPVSAAQRAHGDKVRIRVGQLTMTNHPISSAWP